MDAIRKQPGSPAYAFLAEHHLAEGREAEALRICEAGFQANPTFERGAVVYLTVLRRRLDLRTAREVFERAIAHVPRSARLRVAWGLVLVDGGQEREARQVARDALDHDPASAEARSLLATLGGAIPSSPGTESQVPGGQGPTSVARADVRPWVRPVGQRATPHRMFDLTPTPEALGGGDRLGLGGREISIFDLPPLDKEEELVDEPDTLIESDTLINEIPADLFEETDASAPPPPAAPPPVPPHEPRPGVSVQPQPHPVPRAPSPATTPRRRRGMVFVALALFGAATTVAGVLGYRRLAERSVRLAVERAVGHVVTDELPGYLAAQSELRDLLQRHATHPRVLAELALINAELGARFGADTPVVTQAREQLRRSASADPQVEADRAAAGAFLDLHAGNPEAARTRLAGLRGASPTVHHRLAAAETALAAGDAERARELLDAVSRDAQPAPGLLYTAAGFHRRSSRFDLARQEIELGLKIRPTHIGLRIERALVGAMTGTPAHEKAEDLGALEKAAGAVPRYRSAVRLLGAMQAMSAGRRAEALRAAEQGLMANPGDHDLAVRLGLWEMEPGGDASRACDLLSRHARAMVVYDPSLPLKLVRAHLLLGRPHAARRTLVQVTPKTLSEDARRSFEELEVRCACRTEDAAALRRLCAGDGAALARNQTKLVACIEATLVGPGARRSATLARLVRNRSVSLYLEGLRAIEAGNAPLAVSRLERVRTGMTDPNAALLALAQAHGQAGNDTRALEVARDAVVRDARSVRSRLALAVALTASGHDAEAYSALETLVADRPTDPALLATAGGALLTLGHPEKATALLKDAMADARDSPAVRLLAARVAIEGGRVPEARTHLVHLLKGDPRNADGLIQLGRVEHAEGHAAAAKRRFAAAVQLRPKDPELLAALAKAQAQTGDYRDAVQSGLAAVRGLRAVRREPQAYSVMMDLAKELSRGDPWAKARSGELLFEVTKAKTSPAPAFLELGRIYREKGDAARAVWCFRQAIARDSRLADAYLELGRALRAKKKWHREARAALREYLKLRPHGKEADRARALLDRMR
jgi:tetratricopeptide (TPR) repeat protein